MEYRPLNTYFRNVQPTMPQDDILPEGARVKVEAMRQLLLLGQNNGLHTCDRIELLA
uniref:Uncharacterized protein n=1 Tax=Arion vulgaris TaxID=1028688 RepID=A0A0B7BGJ6_9EUPU